MIDFAFVSFAFIAGIVAFFSPCAAVLLPGYVSYYISKGDQIKQSYFEKLARGFLFGFITIFGFITVFGIAGLLILALGQIIKTFIPWLSVLFGIGLIALGISILLGKHILINLNFLQLKTEKWGLYLFGVAYAVAALGCVFPIFLTIMLQSFFAANFLEAIIPLIAYITGISIVMLLVTMLIIFSRAWISSKINRILPYIHSISGAILILAGAYMIYYQLVLIG